MNSRIVQLVAVAASLVLALPPGWCSGLMRRNTAELTPAKAACCHRTGDHQPSGSQKAPTKPALECCCAWQATVPENSVQPGDTPAPALPLVVADVPPVRVWLVGESVIAPFHCGPRLHVLQCVWRC